MSIPVRSDSSSSVGSRPRLGRELALLGPHLGELLADVDRDPNRPRVLLDAALHGLADPPGRVRRELVAAPVIELLDRPDQAEHALLDQVEEGKPESAVALGVRHDESDVRLDHVRLRVLVSALDPLRELDLLGSREETSLGDIAEEELERVAQRSHARLGGARGARGRDVLAGHLDAAALGLRAEVLERRLGAELLAERSRLAEIE